MECIYIERLEMLSGKFEIPDAESRHLKALRIDSGNYILASNGKGLICKLLIERAGKNQFYGTAIESYPNSGEANRHIAVALGMLDDRNRFEFALEKSIELGASQFIPLISEFAVKSKLSLERLHSKAIASIKQCKRAKLPEITEPVKFIDLLNNSQGYDSIILADENGSQPSAAELGNRVLLIVGPEGGFSSHEHKKFEEINIIKWASV